jgi:uncharacterized Tic20 family protein
MVDETVSKDDRNIAALVHAAGIIFGFIPALIVYLVKKDGSAFLTEQTKEALNFQITVLIAVIISWLLIFVLIGILLLPAVVITNIVLCIIAAIKASNGVAYRYPVAIRLIK